MMKTLRKYLSLLLVVSLILAPFPALAAGSHGDDPIIAYKGTVTGLRISSVDGTAFLDALPAEVVTLVTTIPKAYQIDIYASNGSMIRGVLGEVGTGETVGSVLNVSACENGPSPYDVFSGVSSSGFHAETDAVANGGTKDEILFTQGKLIKSSFTVADLTGSISTSIRDSLGGSRLNGAGTASVTIVGGANDQYSTIVTTDTGVLQFGAAGVATVTISGLAVKQVTAPSITGSGIVSAKGGSTANFSHKSASFIFNETSYRVVVRKLKGGAVVASGSITAGNALIDSTTSNAFAAPVGVDLSAYQTGNYMLRLFTTAGVLQGEAWISGTAPGGLTLSAQKLTNPTFDVNTTGWSFGRGSGASVAGGQSNNCLELTSNGAGGGPYAYQSVAIPIGSLLYFERYAKSGTGGAKTASAYYYDALDGNASAVSTGSWVVGTKYSTAKVTNSAFYLDATDLGTNGQTILFDEASLKIVTDCAATGALLLSSKGGSRGWVSKPGSAGFENGALNYQIVYNP